MTDSTKKVPEGDKGKDVPFLKRKSTKNILTGVAIGASAYGASLVGTDDRIPPYVTGLLGLGAIGVGVWKEQPILSAAGAGLFATIRLADAAQAGKDKQTHVGEGGKMSAKAEVKNTVEHIKAHASAFSKKFMLDKLFGSKKEREAEKTEPVLPQAEVGDFGAPEDAALSVLDDFENGLYISALQEQNPLPVSTTMEYRAEEPPVDFDIL